MKIRNQKKKIKRKKEELKIKRKKNKILLLIIVKFKKIQKETTGRIIRKIKKIY